MMLTKQQKFQETLGNGLWWLKLLVLNFLSRDWQLDHNFCEGIRIGMEIVKQAVL